MQWLMVACGGALGALLRYGLTLVLNGRYGAWPLGTLLVNVLGSLLIGVLAAWMVHSSALAAYRPLLMVGFLGSLTTFSSVSLEVLLLVQQQAMGRAMLYCLGSMSLGVLCAALGWQLGESLARR